MVSVSSSIFKRMESCSFFLRHPTIPNLQHVCDDCGPLSPPVDRDLRPPLVAKSLLIIVGLSSVPPFSHHLSHLRRFCEAGLGKPVEAQEGTHSLGGSLSGRVSPPSPPVRSYAFPITGNWMQCTQVRLRTHPIGTLSSFVF